MARVAPDDDSIDRFVVARYVPRGVGNVPDVADLDAFDSLDEAMAQRAALMAGKGRDSQYVYTVAVLKAGTLRQEANGRVVLEAFRRGEDFERLPEYLDLSPNVGFTFRIDDPNPQDPG